MTSPTPADRNLLFGMTEPSAESIFLAALQECDPAERAAYVHQACGGDAELRARVERLLAAQPHLRGFTHSPAGLREADPLATPGTAATDPPLPSTSDHVPLEGVGAVIAGRYKLLQKLGEGGMGAVFMAEQTQPVRRMVAVKLIKPGMDSAHVLARFEAERQALALMDHPNIAKVLDAGATRAGRPYFIMELVKGVPITRYCDQERLTPHERLALFIPVCQAVQHAHQKGIIHRDLKPSNVLIALYDGRPVPKVIDFGVAKATAQRLTERTMFTEIGQIVGTLEYMSPEQAELNQLDVDTRSDIYSLGVLLYELLTGSPPFTSKQLRSAGFAAMLMMIRESEPPKPSTRLSNSDELPSIAAKRKLEPARLTKLVRGDLDWIAMKCLEKERSRRYDTANGLAHDIEHYLADEPVQAGPPTAIYRLRKFVRRNRTAVASATAFAVVLVAAVIISAWQALRATKAEHAEIEARNVAETESREARAQRVMADLARAQIQRLQLKLLMQLGRPQGQSDRGTASLTARQKRQQRWSLVLNTSTGENYRRQLIALEAILAIPQTDGRYMVVRDLRRIPVQGPLEDVDNLSLIFWIDPNPRSVFQLSQALGIRQPPTHVVAFLPVEFEQELLRKELAYGHRTEDQIRSTMFRLRQENGRYAPEVVEQKLQDTPPKDVSKDKGVTKSQQNSSTRKR